jgi:hypothetical protein
MELITSKQCEARSSIPPVWCSDGPQLPRFCGGILSCRQIDWAGSLQLHKIMESMPFSFYALHLFALNQARGLPPLFPRRGVRHPDPASPWPTASQIVGGHCRRLDDPKQGAKAKIVQYYQYQVTNHNGLGLIWSRMTHQPPLGHSTPRSLPQFLSIGVRRFRSSPATRMEKPAHGTAADAKQASHR